MPFLDQRTNPSGQREAGHVSFIVQVAGPIQEAYN